MLCQQDDRAATVAFSREILRSAEEPMMAEVRAATRRIHLDPGRASSSAAIASGAFADVDPRLTAVQIFGMVNWAWTWFRPRRPPDAAEIADQFSRTVIGGLAPGATREGAEAERLTVAVGAAMRAHPAAAV